MSVTFHKKFNFSASFERAGKIYAHNYVLEIVTDNLDERSEALLVRKVREHVIQKVDSRDLGLHVDFLKKSDFTEMSLLKAFRDLITKEISQIPLRALSLERDKNTRVCLEI